MGSWSWSRQASDGFWGASDNTKASSEGRRDLEDDGAVAVDDDHQEGEDHACFQGLFWRSES